MANKAGSAPGTEERITTAQWVLSIDMIAMLSGRSGVHREAIAADKWCHCQLWCKLTTKLSTTREPELPVSEKMSNAPVYYALAQAHFNPVAAMVKYVDQIQDRLRREGYPLFESQQFMQLIVPGPGPGQAQLQEPQIQQAVSWLMTRSDRTAGFILGPSSITYHTTHYQTHNEFIPELLRGLTAVHEAASLDHVSRLGLRYLDAVLPQAGEITEQYLVGGLHGIDFNATRQHTMTETVFATDTFPLVAKGTLVVRVYRTVAPLGFPPDMLPTGLVIAPSFDIKEAREHAIIDTDHYVQGRIPVEMDRLNEQLLSLHGTIKSVFGATTTDHARSAWA